MCKRFGIDLSARTKHGALLDAELTAQIYLELIGGRQRGLMLAPVEIAAARPRTSRAAAPASGPEPLAPLHHGGGSRAPRRLCRQANWATRRDLETA